MNMIMINLLEKQREMSFYCDYYFILISEVVLCALRRASKKKMVLWKFT